MNERNALPPLVLLASVFLQLTPKYFFFSPFRNAFVASFGPPPRLRFFTNLQVTPPLPPFYSVHVGPPNPLQKMPIVNIRTAESRQSEQHSKKRKKLN